MNPRVLTALSVWISILIPSQGCGPFFPDTVLDKPQAALAVPPVSYLQNLYRLAGKQPPQSASCDEADAPLLSQIPLEVAELRALWEKEGIADDVIARRIQLYGSVREKLLAPAPMQDDTSVSPGPHPSSALPVRPLGDDFPQDVADYVEAARLHAAGNPAEACVIWKGILDRPPAERRLRGAWAAWMLARSTQGEECTSWLERVGQEIRNGATDVLGLETAVKCLSAGKALRENRQDEFIAGVHAFYEAFVGGRESAAIDLRRLSREIPFKGDAELMRAAATDPLVRRLINLEFHTLYDGTGYSTEASEAPSDDGQDAPLLRWLNTIETLAPSQSDDLSRLAWALYAAGRYGESLKVLALCPKDDALALWLQAKFDLREGRLEDANQHLAAALRIQQQMTGWDPSNPSSEGVMWMSGASSIDRHHQSRLLADSGIVSLALKDYLPALESLRKGGFREDAAYLAECVISTDGLIRHIRKVVPGWVPVAKEAWEIEEEKSQASSPPSDFSELLENGVSLGRLGPDNELRYLLGRRLARERRFKEAREFMPSELLPVFDHYVKLDKARRSGRYSGPALAAITWRQARMHRHLGAELFATDCAPDGGAVSFNFSGTQFHEVRTLRAGWHYDWSQDPAYIPGIKPEDKAIPEVTTDEVTRMRKYSVRPMMRYHYRYVAADLAWQASRALPPNHPDLARLYNTAGQWISIRDPQAADRFYQAMVRRCAKTPEGRVADAKHWFLADLEPLLDLPALPADFKQDAPAGVFLKNF